MNKKVLVVVNGGVPYLYAEAGVDAVYVDIDDIGCIGQEDLNPLHPSYAPLLAFAGITDVWPIDDNGSTNDADHLMAKDPQQEYYVAGKGQRCPVCGSDLVNQQGRPLQADGSDAWSDSFCFGCLSSWQDHYQLVGFNNLNHPG